MDKNVQAGKMACTFQFFIAPAFVPASAAVASHTAAAAQHCARLQKVP
jgi:hypothetical protein